MLLNRLLTNDSQFDLMDVRTKYKEIPDVSTHIEYLISISLYIFQFKLKHKMKLMC